MALSPNESPAFMTKTHEPRVISFNAFNDSFVRPAPSPLTRPIWRKRGKVREEGFFCLATRKGDEGDLCLSFPICRSLTISFWVSSLSLSFSFSLFLPLSTVLTYEVCLWKTLSFSLPSPLFWYISSPFFSFFHRNLKSTISLFAKAMQTTTAFVCEFSFRLANPFLQRLKNNFLFLLL